MLLAAKIWHYWMAVGLVGIAVLATIAMVVGYLTKVTMPRYPKRNQRQ